MKKNRWLIIGIASGLLGLACSSHAQENYIPNGDFSLGGKNWDVAYRDPEIGTVTFEKGSAPDGAGYVRLAPLNSAAPRHLALQQRITKFPLPGRYKLKTWMRISEDYAAKMPVMQLSWRVSGEQGATTSESLALPDTAKPGEWGLCEKEIDIPDGLASMFAVLFTYGSMGSADFDGVTLEPLP